MQTLVVGDSWASAFEADTKTENGGWPEIMNVPGELRRGVSGSTAKQWAGNHENWLTEAQIADADAVIISLMGNDARHALADGVVTPEEIRDALTSMRTVLSVLLRPLTIVMLYADPYCGADPKAALAVSLLNGAIQAACYGLDVHFADTSEWLEPEHFDGTDIHPTRAGHEAIALGLTQMLIDLNDDSD